MTQFKYALALPGLLLSTSALAGVPSWTMSETSGQVTVASSGMVRVGSRGATLSAGDVISTGAKGRAVIIRGQEYLVVAPNSRIRVADPAKNGGMTQIIEQFGNVVFKIKKMATPHFAVETPFLAAVVKGTTFSVTVTDSGASVQVIEGRVEVETRDGGARYLVLPGDIGSVSAKALGRLNVQGRETRTIISPTERGGVTIPTAQILQADPVATADAPVASVNATVIAVAVSEPPVRLGPVTDGMVSGALIAMVTTAPERASAVVEAKPVAEMTPVTSGVGNSGMGTSALPTTPETPGAGISGNSNSGAGNGNAATNNIAPVAGAVPPVVGSGTGNNGIAGGNSGSGSGTGATNVTAPMVDAFAPVVGSGSGNGGANGPTLPATEPVVPPSGRGNGNNNGNGGPRK